MGIRKKRKGKRTRRGMINSETIITRKEGERCDEGVLKIGRMSILRGMNRRMGGKRGIPRGSISIEGIYSRVNLLNRVIRSD